MSSVGAPVPVRGGGVVAPASMAAFRSPAEMALREIIDSRSGKVHHLYTLYASHHLTLFLMSPPRASSSGNVGWLRCFRGELTPNMQPSTLATALRTVWLPHVREALKGTENEDHYTFSVGEARAAVGETIPKEQRRSQRAAVPQRIIELKIAYKDSTLIRLPLQPIERDGPLDDSCGPLRPLSPFSGYRADALRMFDRVATLSADLQARLITREEQRVTGEIKLAEQLEHLQRKAMQKCWLEEGVLAQVRILLLSKEKEIARLHAEKAAHSEVRTLHLRSQWSELNGTQSDAAQLGVEGPVDDEERVHSGDSGRNSSDEEQDGSSAATNEEAKQAATKRRTSSAAAARNKRAKREGQSRAATSVASTRKVGKVRMKKSASKRRRIRSPSPISEESDVGGAESEELGKPLSKRRNECRLLATRKRHGEGGSAEMSMTRGNTSISADSVAAHALALSLALPLHMRFPKVASETSFVPPPVGLSLDPSSPPPSLPVEEEPELRHRRRAISPPPRIIPKRSLAEILRAGATGMDMDDEEPEASEVADPTAVSDRRASLRHASQPAPMEMSSQ